MVTTSCTEGCCSLALRGVGPDISAPVLVADPWHNQWDIYLRSASIANMGKAKFDEEHAEIHFATSFRFVN